MKELNKEYHLCAKYTESRDGHHFISVKHHKFTVPYNYRLLECYHYLSGYNEIGMSSFELPFKYRYSSGMSSSHAYKLKS